MSLSTHSPDGTIPATGQNDHLCSKCQAALTPYHVVGYTYLDESIQNGIRSTWKIEVSGSPETTARAGCPLCRRFVECLSPSDRAWLFGCEEDACVTVYDYTGYQGRFLHAWMAMTIYVPDADIKDPKAFLSITSSVEFLPESAKHCMNTGVIEASTDSNATQSLITAWLAECTQGHTKCPSIDTEPNPLPRRIIDITPGQHLRLALASELNAPARYATLSHCWGNYMPLTLRGENLAAFRHEIPADQLSKTFQDAVTIARLAGVAYLWIDSLCIIQDSPSDWRSESVTMASVYSNAWCNISAAHAHDGTVGCFAVRDPAALMPLRVHVPWMGWGVDAGERIIVERDWWERNVHSAPLFGRAWAFQEQIFARRNIIFGRREVFFMCHQMLSSEQFPSGVPENVEGPELREAGAWAQDLSRGDDDDDEDDDNECVPNEGSLGGDMALGDDGQYENQVREPGPAPDLDLWEAMVEEFSRGELTYPTDKLVAFSSIASRMHHRMGGEYLAGLWRTHLPRQLLWYVSPREEAQQWRASEYVAPSWSWASIIVPLKPWTLPRKGLDQVLDVTGVDMDLVDADNHFGQVVRGVLRVRGYLAKLGPPHYDLSSEDIDWDEPGMARDDEEEMFYMLPVFADYLTPDEIGQHVTCVWGLVVKSLASKDSYMRVGTFSIARWNRVGFQVACRHLAAEWGNGNVVDGWGAQHVLDIV